jgi:Flp pilus assembly pilin Flp
MTEAIRLRRLSGDQRGLSTVEYTVLLVLILAGAISLWKELGGDLQKKLKGSVGEFKKVEAPGGGPGGASPIP